MNAVDSKKMRSENQRRQQSGKASIFWGVGRGVNWTRDRSSLPYAGDKDASSDDREISQAYKKYGGIG